MSDNGTKIEFARDIGELRGVLRECSKRIDQLDSTIREVNRVSACINDLTDRIAKLESKVEEISSFKWKVIGAASMTSLLIYVLTNFLPSMLK